MGGNFEQESYLPLLQRRTSTISISSINRNSIVSAGHQRDARKVLLSRPSGVIGEGYAVDKQLVKTANIRGIIFPFDLSYKIWWSVTILGAIATAFFLPYEIAFQGEAFYKDERLIFQRKEIVEAYFGKMFWIDLCGVFPFEMLALLATGNLGRRTSDVLLFSLLRIPRLVRLHRLKRFSDIMQYDVHLSFFWFTLIRNFAAVLFVAHWEACTMYFIARLHNFDEDTWLGPLVMTESKDVKTNFDFYLTSLYLSVVTFATVGYGDFSPTSNIEKLIGSFFMLLNIVVAAWIIGSVTLLIVKGDEKTSEYRDSLDTLQIYGHMNDFNDEFMNNLKSQLTINFRNREVSDEQVLKPFPSAVRRKILRKLYLKPLMQTQLMKGVRPQFVDAFLASCTVEIFSPHEEIVERGSILSDLFLLVGGIAEVTNYGLHDCTDVEHGQETYGERNRRQTKFQAGDFIGEIGFFTESPQVESVTSVTVCKTLTLSRTKYKMLENDHPGSVGKILQNLLSKVERLSLKLPLPEELPVLRAGSVFGMTPGEEVDTVDSSEYGALDLSTEDFSMQKEALTAVKDLIEMHMSKQLDDQTTRLLFSASRGDTATISLMCDQGFDPNNSDYDNRTALMVASMKGNTEVVRVLLDYKADPNLEDMHGSTALLEAVKNGHEDTMLLLKRNKAKLCMNESHAASILCQAVFDSDSTFLRRLLTAGVNVNAKDYDMRTAVHIAACEGNVHAFQLLVRNGANLKVEDRWGNTPEMDAQRHGSKKILDFLSSQN